MALCSPAYAQSEESTQETKGAFRKFVESVQNFLYEVAQGPRANRKVELPEEFQRSDFVVRKIVDAKNLLYVEALPPSQPLSKGTALYAFITVDNAACEVHVISVVDKWMLVENRNCQRFVEIEPGHYLVPKTKENSERWRPRYSHDYIAGWVSYGSTEMTSAGTDYSGANLRYGARAALDLSPISRVQLNYGIGKNDLDKASAAVTDSFQGVSYSSFHVLGRWSEKWRREYGRFVVMPMLGIGTVFEELKGHPTFRSGGGGLSLAAVVEANHYKTILDVLFNYCLIGCYLSEHGPSAVAEYKDPRIFEFRATAKSAILPWPGWGLLTAFEYYSIGARRAYLTSDSAKSRKFANKYMGLSLGLTYSWQ